MNDKQIIDQLNAHAPKFLKMLGGRLVSIDRTQRSCIFEFNVSTDFCHSVDIVQGGFVTVMLDAAMSHALFGCEENVVGVSSLEIKTSYPEVTRSGQLKVVGRVLKAGYKTAFLEGQLYNADGVLTATASSVAKVGRKS